MNKEHVSALLEVISFFFVGIDLYGPDRLAKAQSRLLYSSEYLRDKVNSIQNFEWKKQRANTFMIVIYILSVVITLVWLEWGLGFLSGIRNASFGQIIGGAIGFVFFCGFTLLIILINLAFLIGALNLAMWMTGNFVKGLIIALKSYHMEGVLLFTGTILFILSKYVQFYT